MAWARAGIMAAMAAFAFVAVAASAEGGDTPAPEGAAVYFVNLKDGDTVKSPVLVQFGLKGMGVSPAGVPDQEHTGHHHLLIDATLEGDALKLPIPSDDNHVHFGKGQTETSLDLAPGKHTLQLVLGDWKHVPHTTPVMSEKVTITVE